jgi:hypothetical protein
MTELNDYKTSKLELMAPKYMHFLIGIPVRPAM